MSNVVQTNYYKLASGFQQAKIAGGATEEGKAFKAAKDYLKAAFNTYRAQNKNVDAATLADKFFYSEAGTEKATRKFTEWMKKPVEEEQKEADDIVEINDELLLGAAAGFEKAYIASLDSVPVEAARVAKRAFKAETRVQLAAGRSIASLQAELAGLSAQTVSKVAYWANKFKA